jgi:hypothetical protein
MSIKKKILFWACDWLFSGEMRRYNRVVRQYNICYDKRPDLRVFYGAKFMTTLSL